MKLLISTTVEKAPQNENFVQSILSVDNGEVTLISPLFNPADQTAFRHTLNVHFINVGYALQQKQFPEHTQICDIEVLPDGGTRASNLRYPDEPLSSPTGGES